MSSLDEDLKEAKRLGYGVWYGRYKADHPGEPVAAKTVVQEVPEEDPRYGVCEVCGNPFRKYNRHQKRCGGECTEIYHRRLDAERYRQKTRIKENRTCPVCAAVFLLNNRSQKYCGSTCRRLAESKRKTKLEVTL